MRALVLKEYGILELQEVPEPSIGPGEVLVRVKACGICGSDVHGMDGSSGRRIPPIIMGHEASGVISSVGEGISDWVSGDRVTFDSMIYCGKCSFCRRGQTNLCDSRRVVGVSCPEYRQHGAMAEFIALPANGLHTMPASISHVQAAMVEPAAVALHAVGRPPVRLNDSAVVIGSGLIGLLIIQALRLAGCGRIVAVDLNPSRLEVACRMGADVGLESAGIDVPARVLEMTSGRGADLVFEAVGLSETLQMATLSVRKGGALVLVGNIASKTDFLLQDVVTRELTLYGSCVSSGEYATCLDMLERGSLDVDSLISVVAPLSEGASWFDRLREDQSDLLKVILEP